MRRAVTLLVAVVATVSLNFTTSAQSKSRSEAIEEIRAKRAELDRLETEFLEPSASDRKLFADLLRSPHTGLIRLLPREKFDSETYQKNKKTMTMRGAGAYYSFSRLTHEYGFGSDISLDSDYLYVGFAGADYGMLINIGAVDLVELSIDSPIVATLARYQTAGSEPEARIEQTRFGSGTTIEGLSLKNRLPLEVNATYLLRSVVFDRSDVLVAFKVVRRDLDGSVIIAWKLMHNYAVPKLARNNRRAFQP